MFVWYLCMYRCVFACVRAYIYMCVCVCTLEFAAKCVPHYSSGLSHEYSSVLWLASVLQAAPVSALQLRELQESRHSLAWRLCGCRGFEHQSLHLHNKHFIYWAISLSSLFTLLCHVSLVWMWKFSAGCWLRSKVMASSHIPWESKSRGLVTSEHGAHFEKATLFP